MSLPLADIADARRLIDAGLQASISWSTVLRYMGLVYAHHPDYREEWKP